MRTLVLSLIVLGVASAGLAATPETAACAGDPSVCGVERGAECTLRDGTVALADRACWRWI